MEGKQIDPFPASSAGAIRGYIFVGHSADVTETLASHKLRMGKRELLKVEKIARGTFIFVYQKDKQTLHALWVSTTAGYDNKNSQLLETSAEISVQVEQLYTPVPMSSVKKILKYHDIKKHDFFMELGEDRTNQLIDVPSSFHFSSHDTTNVK